MPTSRSYGDACAIARALDVVGERWALLVVRELLLGPQRFSDLRHALPGATSNPSCSRSATGAVTSRCRPRPPLSAPPPWCSSCEAPLALIPRRPRPRIVSSSATACGPSEPRPDDCRCSQANPPARTPPSAPIPQHSTPCSRPPGNLTLPSPTGASSLRATCRPSAGSCRQSPPPLPCSDETPGAATRPTRSAAFPGSSTVLRHRCATG